MYQREEPPRPSSVYIPPSYRGNALFLEQLAREEDGRDGCEHPHTPPCEREAPPPPPPQSGCREEGLLGRITAFLGSDGAVVAAVVLFLLFSRKGKEDDRGDDLLTLLVLLLALM